MFEADFEPVSFGFRPKRRAQDAIAEIQFFGSKGYRWVLDADIQACFDEIGHTTLMDRVRARIADKRVQHAGQLHVVAVDPDADAPAALEVA